MEIIAFTILSLGLVEEGLIKGQLISLQGVRSEVGSDTSADDSIKLIYVIILTATS